MDVKYFTENLGLQVGHSTTSCGSEIFFYHRHLEGDLRKPIFVLIHGYPQSSFEWRHVISHLPQDIPLFVPDLPGYGRSTPSTGRHDKRTIGQAILEALATQLKREGSQDILIIGHDRGARICHRLAVDGNEGLSKLKIIGSVLLDIVPTKIQYESFANPQVGVGTFHWPFLANVELATDMIKAYGGPKFCQKMIEGWAGSSDKCLQSLRSHNAMAIYTDFFNSESVIRATCEDYSAGAKEDIHEQDSDQANNKKIGLRTLVMYSVDYLGSRFDLGKVWREWVKDSTLLQIEGIEESGHFLAEEEPETTTRHIMKFYESLV